MTPKINYKEIAEDGYKIITDNFGFLGDMEWKANAPTTQPEFTQKEAKKMARILGRLYMVLHCVECDICGAKYRNDK